METKNSPETDKFLQESGQIQITDLVREHAQKASEVEITASKDTHPNLLKALKVAKYIYSLPRIEGLIRNPKSDEERQQNEAARDRIFRKRTVQEILEQGIFPTCSDIGIVFRGLMIALDVPTAYVETFHEDYLLGKKFHGHVVGKIQAGDKWYYIDPQNNERRVSKTEEDLFPLIIFKEGLDSWDIGIRGYDDIHKLRLENIDMLIDKYKEIVRKIYEGKLEMADKIKTNPELSGEVQFRNGQR